MNIEKLRNKAWTKANDLINIIYNNSPFDFDSKLKIVMYRIKTEDSILKRLNEGKYPDNYIYDLLGIRYVLNNREDCYQLLDSIKKIQDIKILELKHQNIKLFIYGCNIKILQLKFKLWIFLCLNILN